MHIKPHAYPHTQALSRKEEMSLGMRLPHAIAQYQQVCSPITAHTSASAYATGSFHSQAPLILQYCSTCASNQTQNERAALETGFRFLSSHLLCSALDSSTPSTPKYPSSQRLLQTFTKQHYLLLSMLYHHVYVHDCVIYDIHYL